MEKVYSVFTFHEDNFSNTEHLSLDLFTNKEDAINRIDEYSDSQMQLEKGEIIRKFGDYCGANFVPQEIYSRFWTLGTIVYGKTVRSTFMGEYCYTYRFLIEQEFVK